MYGVECRGLRSDVPVVPRCTQLQVTMQKNFDKGIGSWADCGISHGTAIIVQYSRA